MQRQLQALSQPDFALDAGAALRDMRSVRYSMHNDINNAMRECHSAFDQCRSDMAQVRNDIQSVSRSMGSSWR
jgi:hypothetical protein